MMRPRASTSKASNCLSLNERTTYNTSYKLPQHHQWIHIIGRVTISNNSSGSCCQNTSHHKHKPYPAPTTTQHISRCYKTTNHSHDRSIYTPISCASRSDPKTSFFPLRPKKLSSYSSCELKHNTPSCGIYPPPNMSRHSNPK